MAVFEQHRPSGSIEQRCEPWQIAAGAATVRLPHADRIMQIVRAHTARANHSAATSTSHYRISEKRKDVNLLALKRTLRPSNPISAMYFTLPSTSFSTCALLRRAEPSPQMQLLS